MKKHIALGGTLLLTLGTAVASTLMYGQDEPAYAVNAQHAIPPQDPAGQVTPEMIARLKAIAASTDYITPRVPI